MAKKTKKSSLASRADRHRLYERSVQNVEAEIDFVDTTFRSVVGRKATTIREDFCGTANSSCEWVKRRPSNRAIGVDLDGPTLAWAHECNLSKLKPSQRERITLIEADVRRPGARGTGVDVVLAMNFSYWLLAERKDLVAYFRSVRAALKRDGMFVLDHWTGWESMKPHRETRPYRGFKYTWQMETYNPIDGMAECHIHFRFPDGSAIPRAFTYRWRVWSLPEVQDALRDAGFQTVTVYWEGDDGKGGGNGIFKAEKVGDACASAIQYITATSRRLSS